MTAYSDAWQALEAHHAATQHVTLRERFAQMPNVSIICTKFCTVCYLITAKNRLV